MKSAFLPILASILMGTTALAQDNRILSFEEAKEMADEGDAYGEAVVAFHYSVGWQTEKNLELAAKYAMSSARKGHPLGIFRLGALRRAGEGIEKNEEQGLALQKKALDGLNDMSGNPYAITALGVMLFQGKVVPENKKEAARLYKIAADMGFAPAQFNYAMCAEAGHGVEINRENSISLLISSANLSYPLSVENLKKKNYNLDLTKINKISLAELDRKENQNKNQLQVVVQRSPDALDSRFACISPSGGIFGVLEQNSLSFWELPSGRLLKTVNKPQGSVTDFYFLNDNTVALAGIDKILDIFTEEETKSIAPLKKSRDLLQISNGKKIKIDFTQEDFFMAVSSFSIFDSMGKLVKTYRGSPNYLHETLIQYLQIPKEFLPMPENDMPLGFVLSGGAFESDAANIFRSWMKWGCDNLNYIVEINHPVKIYKIKDGDILENISIKGSQNFPLRFVDSNSSGNHFISWVLPEGFPESNTPPEPLELNLCALESKKISLPNRLLPIKIDYTAENDLCFTMANILENSAKSDLPIMNLFRGQLSNVTGNFDITNLKNISPYIYTEDVFFDFVEAMHLTAEDRNEVIYKEGFKVAEKNMGACDAYWGVSPNNKVQIFKNKNPFIVLQPKLNEEIINIYLNNENLIVFSNLGAYVINANNAAVVSHWFLPNDQSHNCPGDEMPQIHVLKRMLPPCELVDFNHKTKRILFSGKKGSVYLLNLEDSGDLVTIAEMKFQPSGQPVILTQDSFYLNMGGIIEGIHFSNGKKTFPFEQFDLRLNRPDIVLERLGAPDEAVAIAKQLREKRLNRMGVTEDMLQPDFHLPEIEIVGDIPSSTAESELALKIKATDSKYPLDRLRLYVNNVPVNGKEGELLRQAPNNGGGVFGRLAQTFSAPSSGPINLERTIPIKLAAGRNKIQVSVLNSAGAESLYANAEVTCTAQRPKPTLYAVAMGVSEYANPEWNLKYAAKDARDILERVNARSGSSYGEIKELLLTDREATKESLGKIRDFLSQATVDDTVLLFVAGHGLLDSKYDYYFGTSDIDFDNPSANGIAFEEFDDLLAELPCLRKSLLIDTCHAGELDEDEKKMLASAQANSNQVVAMLPTGARGMTIKPIEGARGKSEWYDRLQGLFVDLRRGSGSTILSSSAGAEYALESSEQKNGLFTYAVLEALDGKEGSDANKDGSVTMSELADYVKTRVATLTNNKQSPNVRRVNLESDFALSKK